MVPEHMKKEIRGVWYKAFEDLKQLYRLNKLKGKEVCDQFTPRQMTGLYAVASICYASGNHSHEMIENIVFDHLCKWIERHFAECVEAGADKLKQDLLSCHSGYDTKIFVKPYHEVAEVLLGHPCRCTYCTYQEK